MRVPQRVRAIGRKLRRRHRLGGSLEDHYSEVTNRWPDLSVIILTAYGTIPDAVRATQCGAFGFLVKPIEKIELLGQVQRAILASPFTYVKGQWRADIVSRSQLMEDRLGQANRAARSDVSVLLSGENGTGKELFARAIHAASRRREKPFIVVRCAHREEKILEAQLFGDDKDSCAGESGCGRGSVQAARGGTLFLDEIGYLPLHLQVRLVGALREHQEFGGHREGAAPADVRVLCSTSGDLGRLRVTGRDAVARTFRCWSRAFWSRRPRRVGWERYIRPKQCNCS
jgi:two-component system, NtrC family, response regulator GlrR